MAGGRRFLLRRCALAVAFGGLSACAVPIGPVPPAPSERPARVVNAPAQTDRVASAESRRLAERYAQTEDRLRSLGLLRTDGGGADTPFDADTLARNFLRIAMFDEFQPLTGQFVPQETASRLRRWEGPVRLTLVFGGSVADAQREADRGRVAALAGRLAAAARHDIGLIGSGGNFTVFVVDEDERRGLSPALLALVPGLDATVRRTITDMPEGTFCLVIAFSADAAPAVYRQAIAVVRAEHPPVLREACFHEEITQGLGLANDSPEVRPSIFNDDKEFAYLTRQDELMLRILYDPRLTPGMTLDEAAPLVREVAREIAPGPVETAAAPEES